MAENEKTLTFSPEAIAELEKIRQRIAHIGEAFGERSTEFVSASVSFNNSMLAMIRLGGKVYRDSDLNLICHNEWITYGVNFHSKYYVAGEEPEIVLEYAKIGVDARPGTWSVNS